jgi:hypothetical protein
MWILLALAMVAASASADTPDASQPAAPAVTIDPVFDCYSANSAWGLAYSGKMIDRAGHIWSYSRRGAALPLRSGSGAEASYTRDALRAKFDGAAAGSLVDAIVLAEKIALIDKATAGKVTWTDTGVRDAGTSTCHAYLRDAAGSSFRDVELGSDGGVADRRSVNDAPEAKALLDWLHSLGVAR